MASSIKLTNANGKILTITNPDSLTGDSHMNPTTTAYTIETVDDFGSVPSGYTTVIVKDSNRGGTFTWSATGTANGGTVFAGLTGYWNRQYSGAVNVKWFGALGDGVTDDTSAIQLAIDASNDLFIPYGTFMVGETTRLLIASKVNFSLTGVGIIKLANNSVIPSSHAIIYILDSEMVSINNVKLDGNNINNTSNTLSATGLVTCIYVDNSSNVEVINCTIKNSNNVSIYFNNNSTNCVAQNNVIYDSFGTDIKVANNSIAIIDGNHLEYSTDVHLGVPKQDGFFMVRYGDCDTIFSNNKIIVADSLTTAPSNIIWILDFRSCIISNNDIYESYGAKAIGADQIVNNSKSMIITNNRVNAGPISINSTTAKTLNSLIIDGNYLSGASNIAVGSNLTITNSAISNNNIEYSSSYAISVGSNYTSCTGNSIKQTNSAASHAILLTGIGATCNNNRIDLNGDASRGIEIYSTYSVINGNTVLNSTSNSIKEQGSADYNIITSNNRYNCTSGIVVIGANTITANNK